MLYKWTYIFIYLFTCNKTRFGRGSKIMSIVVAARFFVIILLLNVVGSGKPAEMRQTSALYVETVEKKPGLSKVKSFQGDASKVLIQGTGLKKGFVGRAGAFTLDVKDAGIALCTAVHLLIIIISCCIIGSKRTHRCCRLANNVQYIEYVAAASQGGPTHVRPLQSVHYHGETCPPTKYIVLCANPCKSTPKRHLSWFIRFCRTVGSVFLTQNGLHGLLLLPLLLDISVFVFLSPFLVPCARLSWQTVGV